jgi:hypothetical protein
MALKAALRPATAAEMRTALRQATSALAHTAPHLGAAHTNGGHSRHEATVLNGGTQIFNGHDVAPSTLSQTRQRPYTSQAESELTIVDSSLDVTRASIKPYSHTSFHAPETPQARRHSPMMIVGVALTVLVACAFVAFPLLRSPATTVPSDSGAQSGTQIGAPGEAQLSAPGATQTEATLQTLNPASGQALSTSPNSRIPGESRTQTGQSSSGEAETAGGSVTSADGAKGVSSPVEASADKSGLVIQQSPAASSQPGNTSAAEYDAQRAEELRRKRQQQELELQQQRQREQEAFRPPPPPPHHGGGYPPPGGEHRPPPRRPPNFR